MAFQLFANLTEDDIDAFQENAINKNTKTSTFVNVKTEGKKFTRNLKKMLFLLFLGSLGKQLTNNRIRSRALWDLWPSG